MLSMNQSHKSEYNRKLNDYDTTDITHNNLSYSSQNSSRLSPVEHLDVNSFKIQPCQMNNPHSHKRCPYFHNIKDRKRLGQQYSAELCEYLEANQHCPNGDNCNKAHNRVEQLYRSDNYKTKFCTFYPSNIVNCEYGKFCSFAHSEEDISIELIHNLEYDEDFYMFYYKTVWCPFNLTQHDKSLCVYAHNWQDFRRKPNVYQYQPFACQNWRTTDFVVEYQDGCQEGFNCTKCHGWKELEYHQVLFRTKQCQNFNCIKIDCSFFHPHQIKRTINQLHQCGIFKLVPRNRIVKNTFKVLGDMNYNSQQKSQNLSQELRNRPMYLSQQEPESYKDKYQNYNGLISDSHWLTNDAQNSSMSLDPETKCDEKLDNNDKKNKYLQPLLVTIQERRDSYDTKELRPSYQVNRTSQYEDQDNENVEFVLNMIDMDN